MNGRSSDCLLILKPSRYEMMHISGKGSFQDFSRDSQQRDCPGFAPDSLLIRTAEMSVRNQFGAKIMETECNTKNMRLIFRAGLQGYPNEWGISSS